MPGNLIFNATVCIMGIAILSIHAFNSLFKKNKRKDEKRLILFLVFTIFHFATYLVFTFVRVKYTSDNLIITFYTLFYIFNNIEMFLLFLYMLSYLVLKEKVKKVLSIVNISLFSAFVLLDIVNIFTGMFFTAESGEYLRSKTMIISQGYQFVILVIVFITSAVNKKLLLREQIAFTLYCLLPFVAILLQNVFKGYAIAYASIIIAIEILFFFINVSKNITIAQQEEANKEAQIKVMMSQIQPHFIYNSLSSISTLIPINPDKAQKALDDFTEYLRHNLSSLSETKLIPFESEFRHIETFIALEKIRFNDRINTYFDIKAKDFFVPPLSLQPIVENAIKHGILNRIEGGTLTIRTFETDDAYVVRIIDDGVGFDINSVDFESNTHIGINNIKSRLNAMCNAEIEIESEPGQGTEVRVTFYK